MFSSWILQRNGNKKSRISTAASDIQQDDQDKGDEVTAAVGSCLEVKRVDEVYDLFRHEYTLRDSKVSELKDAKENAKDKYERYAFTVVHKSKSILLDIKSPQLKKACEHVIGDVQGISWTVDPLQVRCYSSGRYL